MKSKVKKIQIGIIFLILLTGCVTSNTEEFSMTPQILSSAEYGYTPENPIAIWAPTAQAREQKKSIFLERLRSQNGEKFEIIQKNLVPNPHYEVPRIKLYNIYTDEIINKGKGEFIESYILRSSREKDTVNIYIATHTRGRSFVPVGQSFANN